MLLIDFIGFRVAKLLDFVGFPIWVFFGIIEIQVVKKDIDVEFSY